MGYSSSPIEPSDAMVLDTSVLINLSASKYGERILVAIPNDILVPTIVAEELEHERSRRNGDYEFLQALVSANVVNLARLTDAEYEIFSELTSTSPSLDDGEAATIAVAANRRLLSVIDDKRGRARASFLVGDRTPRWSLDLFRHPAAVSNLADQAVEALYCALRFGRMRIPSESVDGVVALLGADRSRDCTCLPGYRDRFGSESREP